MPRCSCKDVNHNTAYKKKLETWKFMSNDCLNELCMNPWAMQTFKLMSQKSGF